MKNNEPNMEDMKKSIEKAGGLFRGCSGLKNSRVYGSIGGIFDVSPTGGFNKDGSL